MTYEEHKKRMSEISDEKLLKKIKEHLQNLCQTGGRSFTMHIPVSPDDFDVLLVELMFRYEKMLIPTKDDKKDLSNYY